MIWATVSSWSCFCWLYRASPSLAAKIIINLNLVLTIWWCPCVESSLVLLEEGVCCDQCIFLAKLVPNRKRSTSRLYILTLLIYHICRVHHEKRWTGRKTIWNQDCWGNINNLRYADDTTLMAESEEELKSLLMKGKVKNEKAGLKLNIQKM